VHRHRWLLLGITTGLGCGWLWPLQFIATLTFVADAMLDVSVLVIPGILVSAWVSASGAGAGIRQAFSGAPLRAVVLASLIGAITPVCGVTVLPLMAGLLAAGVPLAPVMAFWLSSPVTDPAMFTVTVATLGVQFAVFKTLFAFLLGLVGGLASASPILRSWTAEPLRQGGLAAILGQGSICDIADFEAAIWRRAARRQRFGNEVLAMTRLIGICLGFAFAVEYLMQQYLQAQAFAGLLGKESAWAIPLAVFVGSPAYLDGYAALPLVRGLIDHGMSPGAAMAFLVSGSVVSIWGALAIIPVLKLRPFLLYLALALAGSAATGWIYDAFG
jgi:uncharacterized membrane protein YraQ (UPF0718 family)